MQKLDRGEKFEEDKYLPQIKMIIKRGIIFMEVDSRRGGGEALLRKESSGCSERRGKKSCFL